MAQDKVEVTELSLLQNASSGASRQGN